MSLRALLVASLLAVTGAPRASSAGFDDRCSASHQAAQSLFARVGPEGRFVYRIDHRGRERSGYNVIRHAGALWVLQAYNRANPDADHQQRLARSSAWLANCCLRPVDGWPGSAVWSDPEKRPQLAKLGAAGLALAAWEGLAEQGLSAPGNANRLQLARFVVYLQRPDGSFHARFREGRRDGRWVSLYYPGEAALGLLARYRVDRNETWTQAATLALDRLARDRAASGVYPPDHWALIATRELENLNQPVDTALRVHARRVAEAILDEQSPRGDFGNERRTAPAATRLEALAAAYDLLAADDPDFAGRLRASHARGAAFLREVQVGTGPWTGAIPRAAADSPDPRRAELRIDDTQHALSVFLDDARLQKYTCTRP